MKKVIKCSISGVAFTLDTDAYEALREYLDTLHKSYKQTPDGAEIVADIEARIAELILSAQDNAHVVEKPLVINVIKQMGTPEDIASDRPEPTQGGETRFPRRLYRDTVNAKLGGVCAGIGRYFDIDPTWVRLALFSPLLLMMLRWVPFMHWTASIMGNLFGILVICYLIMWFVIPIARTARQRLEMSGERITAQSIRNATETTTCDPDSKAKPIIAEAVSILGKIVLMCLKILLGIFVFALIMIACSLIAGLFVLLISGPEILRIALPSIWVPILGIFVAFIPVVMLIYVFMCIIASRKPGGKTIFISFLLWIVSIAACASIAISEQFIDRVQYSSERLEDLIKTDLIIDGDTTSVGRLLRDDSRIEAVLEDDNKTVSISVPDKQISITVGKKEAHISVDDKTITPTTQEAIVEKE